MCEIFTQIIENRESAGSRHGQSVQRTRLAFLPVRWFRSHLVTDLSHWRVILRFDVWGIWRGLVIIRIGLRHPDSRRRSRFGCCRLGLKLFNGNSSNSPLLKDAITRMCGQ